METPDLTDKIARAKELLQTVRHAALATVNEDGSPHNSPVFAGFDGGLAMHWASLIDAQHSLNIARTGQAFIVLFDSMHKGGGLYLQCTASELHGTALDAGLQAFNNVLAKNGRPPVPRELFEGDAPQRLYRAEPTKLWVNMAQKDAEGRVLGDVRYEVNSADLL